MKIKYSYICKMLLVVLLVSQISCDNQRKSDNLSNRGKETTFSNAPGTYTIKSNPEDITIPFDMYAGNKPMILGKTNGREVKFLIDNGKLFDEIWFYNGEVDSIGLHFQSQDADSLIGIGQNDASLIFEGTPINVDFDKIAFNDQPTLISPVEEGYADFFPGINGQVSSMLFKHFVVRFDFENNLVSLIEPDKFRKSVNQQAIKMQKRANGSYCVPFEILLKTGSVYNLLLDIDLGTIFPLYIISNRENEFPIPSNGLKQFIGYGASGELFGYNDTIQELRFGDFVIENYPVLIVREDSNSNESVVESGTFGIQLMSQFNVTFDYFNEIIYFEPNNNFNGRYNFQ